MKISTLLSAIAVLLPASLRADEICTPTLSLPLAPAGWETQLAVPRFDPALGTLTEVRMSMSPYVESDVGVEHTGGGRTYVVRSSTFLSVSSPNGNFLGAIGAGGSADVQLGPFDGVIDFAGTSGRTMFLSGWGSGTLHYYDPSLMALFTGPAGAAGSVLLLVRAPDTSGTIPQDQIVTSFTTRISAAFVFCYVYDPTRVSFCAGDGTATACPCGNDPPPGLGAGCANSTLAGGWLTGSGVSRLSADSFVLQAIGLPANTTALFVQGTERANGGLGTVFGDGLQCVGGTVMRLGLRTSQGDWSRYPGPGDQAVSVRGAVGAPGLRTYQVWYRNAAPFCTASTFNLTQGLQVTWAP